MIDLATRKAVRDRAKNRCEYCLIPQAAAPFLSFHIEHIFAVQHIDDDSLGNLCLACPHCNLHKGPNLTSIHPETRKIVPLFHPRNDLWSQHFQLQDGEILGLTESGLITVSLLKMNDDEQVKIRQELMMRGMFADSYGE